MKRKRGPAVVWVKALVITVALFGTACAQPRKPGLEWHLVWHDEFDGPAGAAPDPSKWVFDIGRGGWGNREEQYYADSADNVFQNGKGSLIIRALRTPSGFTSGRIKTQGKFSFTFGKLDARIKIPYAKGVWPAFWLLGDSPGTPWPNVGEIDVLENFGPVGSPAYSIQGTLHGPGYAGTGITAKFDLPNHQSFADAFHLFSVERLPGSTEFFVDGVSYHKVFASDPRIALHWVFDAPLYILMNVAVGGWPAPVGAPALTTPFPQQMLVDYVRVYQSRTHPATPR